MVEVGDEAVRVVAGRGSEIHGSGGRAGGSSKDPGAGAEAGDEEKE